MALQSVGEADMHLLLREARRWSTGNWYEKRAAAAGLAEPRLLADHADAAAVLDILDAIMASMEGTGLRSDESFKVLRQGMGYCWSVAVAANPDAGKPLMERWLRSSDPDIRWVLKENLRKNRLARMDAAWTKAMAARLRS